MTVSVAGLDMPGVNLDLLPASAASEALGSPDSACAESGLEDVIGDLLAQEVVEEEEEHVGERKFEVTLRCAVGEIHSDLQAFGKRVDARLEETAAQVAPLARALAILQEENLRLRIQQERLVRQVESMCQLMGLPDPVLRVLPSPESSPSTPCETKTPSSLFSESLSCTPQDSPLHEPQDPPSFTPQDPPCCTPRDPPCSTPQDPPSCTPQDPPCFTPHDPPCCTPQDPPSFATQDLLSSAPEGNVSDAPGDTPLSVPQEPMSCPQASAPRGTNTCQTSKPEPSPVPHPPTFATCRSLSAPSLMGSLSRSNSLVMLHM